MNKNNGEIKEKRHVAHMGGSCYKLKLKVDGEMLEGKELKDYLKKRNKKYWDEVKEEMKKNNKRR